MLLSGDAGKELVGVKESLPAAFHVLNNTALVAHGETIDRRKLSDGSVVWKHSVTGSIGTFGNDTAIMRVGETACVGTGRQITMLNTETGRYVYRILALKEIHKDPGLYGFHFRDQDLYAPYKTRTVEVDSSIDDLAQFAIDHGTGYKELKILNPWLRETHLENSSGKTYKIRLPKPSSEKLIHKDTGIYRNDTLRKKVQKDSLPTEEEK